MVQTPRNNLITFPDWQAQFQDALLEFDPEKLQQRVRLTVDACRRRQRIIYQKPRCEAEWRAIKDALFALTELMYTGVF